MIKDTTLNRLDFESELLKLPAKCKKLTNKTARIKVKEIFEKYEFLISYTLQDKNRYKEKAYRLQNICKALKSGIVVHKGGFFMVSEILRVLVEEDSVIVFYKNGTQQTFVKEYEWLVDLF